MIGDCKKKQKTAFLLVEVTFVNLKIVSSSEGMRETVEMAYGGGAIPSQAGIQ